MKTDVLFRFDAGLDMGLGHLRRSLELARTLKSRGVKNVSVVTATPKYTRSWVGKDFPIHTLKANSIADEIREILNVFTGKPALMIVDHYGYTSKDIDLLQNGGMPIIAFDDRGEHKNSSSAGIINHNIYGKTILYRHVPVRRQYCGSSFTIINAAIRKARLKRKPSDKLSILFSAGGGTDTKLMKLYMHTFKAVQKQIPEAQALLAGGIGSKADLVLPKGMRLVPASKMAEAMRQANMAVSASGVTAYELACAGVPALLYSVIDNQDRVKSTLCKMDAAQGLIFKNLTPSYLEKKILKFWSNETRRIQQLRTGKRLIDGRGVERLAQKLIKDFKL